MPAKSVLGGEVLAVAIRLRRMGRKKKPTYRIVVADDRNPRQGKFVEDIGYYNPMEDPPLIQINEEKALMWLKDGAEPSETTRSLLSEVGILQKFHEQRQSRKEDETQPVEQSDSEEEEEP